jgi:hypothetical protein
MAKHFNNCKCPQPANSPYFAPGFSRRGFLQIAGTGLVASFFTDVFNPQLLEAATVVNPPLLNTARNCILVFLNGGPSQVDMWDLKEGPWTPADFTPTSYGNLRFPQGLMPKIAEHSSKLGIIRSGLAWAAVHQLAVRWSQIARNPSGATAGIAPHIGAVVSLESQRTRTADDVLPGFVAINGVNAGAGYFPAAHAPFGVVPSPLGLTALTHPEGAARFDKRYKLVEAMDTERGSGELGRESLDMSSFYGQAKRLIDTPNVNGMFAFTAEERARYGNNGFGDALIVARNLLASNRGTRFVQVTLGGWDHHQSIYVRPAGIYAQATVLDNGLGTLLTDLSTRPGAQAGKTLLDETLIVVLGEFGRTAGAPTSNGIGRDHNLRQAILMAGGGVKGGRIIGRTNDTGTSIVEYGWNANRDIRPEDVTATIYSALGIDYTAVRKDDPLGRGFEYVPFAKDGQYAPVTELF